MNLTPAAQALAVWLELRIHRPDLLFARTAHKDHGNIAEDQASRGHGLFARFFERHESLEEGEIGAVVGVCAHLAGLADDDERFGRGRQEYLFDRSGIGRDHERGAGGDPGFAAEAFTLDHTNCGEERLTGRFLADEQETRLRTLRIPDVHARYAWLADYNRFEGGDRRLDGSLAGGIESRTVDDAQLLDRPVGKA